MEKIGYVDFTEPIKPFQKSAWESLDKCRDSIEHRGETEASMLDALNCLGCLAVILRKNSRHRKIHYHDFESDLFNIKSLADIFRMR